jgi:hypothetical protein
MTGSTSLSINKEDVKKNAKIFGLGVAALAITFVADTLPAVDLGHFTPIAVVFVTGLLDLGRRWLADNS